MGAVKQAMMAFGQASDSKEFGDLTVVEPVCDFCWEVGPDGMWRSDVDATHVFNSGEGPVYTCDKCV